MSKHKSSRREYLHADATATWTETNDGNRSFLVANYSCSTTGGAPSKRTAYSQKEAEARQHRARERIDRTREAQRAARYFRQLQRGCVRHE